MKKGNKPYDASDENDVSVKEEEALDKRNQELDDIRDILSRKSGVRFFKRIMENGKIFCTTFTGNSTTFFNEGMRSNTLRYFNDVCEAAPEMVAEIMINKTEDED